LNEALTWTAVIAAGGGGSVITFITFWMALSKRISDAEAKAEVAEDRAESADKMAAVALAKHEMIVQDLNQDKVKTAERIAGLEAITRSTTASLAQAESRLAKSLEDVGDKIDHLSDTLIKTLSDLVASKKI